MGAVEQVAEDAEQGGAVFDRPASGLREVAVEVERAFRDARFRIDPEVETQALVDIAHTDDLVHPGVRKATWLLIMSTRRSAKVSNDAARTLRDPPPLPGGERCIGADQFLLDEPRCAKRHKRLGPLFRRHVLGEGATDLRGGLESVTAEADRDEEALGADPVQDRQRSPRHVVGARPYPSR